MHPSKPSLDNLRIERKPSGRGLPAGWVAGLVALVLVGAAAAWWLTRPGPMEVRTAVAAEKGPAGQRTVLDASGYVTARRSSTVSSKVTGKVVEVLIEEGKRVEEGQVLARLDDTNVKASLRLAEAQLVSASNALAETRVRIKEAEQELERQAGLLKNRIATQADYDHAEASALALKARLTQQEADIVVAERQVASWQQQLEDTIIRAPFAGIVTAKNAQPGEMISPMSAGGFTRTGICTIVDMQSLEGEVDVSESYINRVEPAQPVEAVLDAYPDWKIPCHVIAIIPTADRQKSTVKVRVGFQKLDPRILPDMSIKVAFREAVSAAGPTAAARSITLPKAAVHQVEGKDVVMVVRDGRVERRAVIVGATGSDEAVVNAGVSTGEKVVIDWPPGLADGVRVKEAKP